jgi:hypothetical protein
MPLSELEYITEGAGSSSNGLYSELGDEGTKFDDDDVVGAGFEGCPLL